MAKPKILIAGAGLGGLATACCLLKRGFDVEVYEQAPVLSEVGAGIQISANAMHVLRYLGLGDAILRVGVQPKAYVFRLHDTGEMIQTFALSEEHRRQHGAPYIQLHRADLHDLLVDTARELKPDVVHLNRKVVGFVERDGAVELNFAQGAPARGGMLIGADGLKSVVRAQLFDTVPPTYTGDGVWRVTVSTERLPPEGRLEQVMSMFMGPGGHAVCYYLRGGAVLNFAGTVEAPVSEESWTLKFPWENLKADFAGWHPAIQAIIDAADRKNATAGRCIIARRSVPGARGTSPFSAMPRIRRSPTSRRAPPWRSRTALFSRAHWSAKARSRRHWMSFNAIGWIALRAWWSSRTRTRSCSTCIPRRRSDNGSRNGTRARIATVGSIPTIH
jgi:2-polyprenyl-6-methoxyphenol hydroxylase-like FAD-dependent oxidoreductase